MSQEIIQDYPPLYNRMARAFNLHPNDGVIFSWGDRIYNPSDQAIPPQLVEHDAVHGERQLCFIAGCQASEANIRAWWREYIKSWEFRLNEEIPAHRAEYQWLMANGNRRERRAALKRTAARLAAPLYGGMITSSAAMDILKTH